MFMASGTLAALTVGRLKGGIPNALVNYANDDNWTPTFLNAHQNETVIALTDLIIPRTDTPGAKDANVHRYMDLFLSVKDAGEQKKFVDGLAWLDGYAQDKFQKDFVHCAEPEQVGMLERMSASGKTDVPQAGCDFFVQVKTLTSQIYFNTPEGYKELKKFGMPPQVEAGTVVGLGTK